MKRRGVKTSEDFKDSLEFHRDLAEMLKEDNEKQAAVIERLRKALDFYTIRGNYWSKNINGKEFPSPIFEDRGKTAQEALTDAEKILGGAECT